MNISKVYYQRNFRIGDFQYETIGIGIDLNSGEDFHEALEAAKGIVIAYNAEQNHPVPHIEERIISYPIPDIQIEKEEIKSLEDHIMSCNEFKVLESYYLIVKNNPSLQNVYDIKKKQLVAKESKEIIDKTNALCNKK